MKYIHLGKCTGRLAYIMCNDFTLPNWIRFEHNWYSSCLQKKHSSCWLFSYMWQSNFSWHNVIINMGRLQFILQIQVSGWCLVHTRVVTTGATWVGWHGHEWGSTSGPCFSSIVPPILHFQDIVPGRPPMGLWLLPCAQRQLGCCKNVHVFTDGGEPTGCQNQFDTVRADMGKSLIQYVAVCRQAVSTFQARYWRKMPNPRQKKARCRILHSCTPFDF